MLTPTFTRIEVFPRGIIKRREEQLFLRQTPSEEKKKTFKRDLKPFKEIGLDVEFNFYSDLPSGRLRLRDETPNQGMVMVPSAQMTLPRNLFDTTMPYIRRHFYHRILSSI